MRKGNFRILEGFGHWVPDWKGIIALLAGLAVGAIIGNLLVAALGLVFGNGFAAKYGTLIAYPIMFLPPMFIARGISIHNELSERKSVPLNSGHFAPLGAPLCALLAVLMTLAAGFLADPVVKLLPPMPDFLKEALESLTGGNILLNLLCVSIFAPFFEEWLCRGMILRGLLASSKKPSTAIILSAFFFALIHLNPWQAIPAFLLGCLFGYVYYRTRSLSLTMLMHFTNNTLALILGQIDSLKDMESWMDVLEPKLFWSVYAAAALLLVLCIRKTRSVHIVNP